MKIVSAGEITIDRYIDLDISFIGGISLNFAVHAKRCGAAEVSMVGCVGMDEEGEWALQLLKNEGVDISHVMRMPGKTATCVISVVDQGERIYPHGGYKTGVMSDFKLEDSDFDFIDRHDVLVSMFDRSRPDIYFSRLVSEGSKRGRFIADFGDWADYSGDGKPIISRLKDRAITFISGNDETVNLLCSSMEVKKNIVVVTKGAGGSTAIADGKMWNQQAVAVTKPVDSTGCGDAFQAAFSVHYLETGNIPSALEKGAAYAAQIIQHFGAFSQEALPITRE